MINLTPILISFYSRSNRSNPTVHRWWSTWLMIMILQDRIHLSPMVKMEGRWVWVTICLKRCKFAKPTGRSFDWWPMYPVIRETNLLISHSCGLRNDLFVFPFSCISGDEMFSIVLSISCKPHYVFFVVQRVILNAHSPLVNPPRLPPNQTIATTQQRNSPILNNAVNLAQQQAKIAMQQAKMQNNNARNNGTQQTGQPARLVEPHTF